MLSPEQLQHTTKDSISPEIIPDYGSHSRRQFEQYRRCRR